MSDLIADVGSSDLPVVLVRRAWPEDLAVEDAFPPRWNWAGLGTWPARIWRFSLRWNEAERCPAGCVELCGVAGVLRFSGVGEGSNCCKGLGIARRSTAGLGAGAGLQHPRALAAVLHRERSGADLSGMGAGYKIGRASRRARVCQNV